MEWSHLGLTLRNLRGGTERQRTATRYGSVRGSDPGGGEIFCIRPDRPWGPLCLLYNGYRVIPGGNAVGAWR